MGLYNGLGDGVTMRTLMAVAAVLVLAVAGVGGYVMLSDSSDPGEGGAGETGPQYTDADMRWNAVLEEVPTNEGHSTLIHPTIHCPPGMEGQTVILEVEGRRGGVMFTLLPGTNTYPPGGAFLNSVKLSEVTISLNGQPLPLDPTLQATVR